jgi:hypothetical protein
MAGVLTLRIGRRRGARAPISWTSASRIALMFSLISIGGKALEPDKRGAIEGSPLN